MAQNAMLSSSLSNPILVSLMKAFTNDLSYNVDTNFPPTAISTVNVSPINTWPSSDPFGSVIEYEVPRSGMLLGLELRPVSVNTSALAALTTSFPSGFHVFDNITIVAGNKEIYRETPQSLRMEANCSTMANALSMYRDAELLHNTTYVPTNFTTGASSVTSFIPLQWNCLYNPSKAIDTTTVEKMHVRAQIASSRNALGPKYSGTTGYALSSVPLYATYFNLDNATYKAMREKAFKDGKSLNLPYYTHYTESFTAVDAATTASLNLRFNGVCSQVQISLISSTGVQKRINTVSFRVNGVNMLENVPAPVLQRNLESMNHGSFALNPTTVNEIGTVVNTLNSEAIHPLIFDFSIMGAHHNSKNNSGFIQSGVCTFRNLSNPTFELTTGTQATGDVFVVTYRVLNILSIDRAGLLTVHATA